MRNIQHSMQAHTITANVGAIAALPTETTSLNKVQDAVTPGNRLCANGDKRTGYASYGYSSANEVRRFAAQKHEQRQSTVFIHRPYTATNTSDRRVDPVTITTYAAPQFSSPTQTDMAGTHWPSATQGECSDRYSRPSPMASFADMSACAPAPQRGWAVRSSTSASQIAKHMQTTCQMGLYGRKTPSRHAYYRCRPSSTKALLPH